MRHMAAVIAAVIAASTAACSIPEKQLYPPFGCYKQQLSTTAKDPVTIRGRIVIPAATVNGALNGALIEMIGGTGPTFSTHTGGDGSFVIQPRTGGTPLDVHFRVSLDSQDPLNPNLDTYFYPAAPLTDDLDDVEFQILSQNLAKELMSRVNVDLNLQQIMLAITVVDCNDSPQPGATVSTDPEGAPVRYVKDGDNGPVPDVTQPVTDKQTGTAFAANIAVMVDPTTNTATSAIAINATMPDPTNTSMIMTFPPHSIADAPAKALIQVDIQP
jgi:hypothetical protein